MNQTIREMHQKYLNEDGHWKIERQRERGTLETEFTGDTN